MNYLSGAFRYVARGETETQNNIPRLVDRIRTSALPHDRRNAIVQLTEAAKTSPQRQVEVGEVGLKVLYAVLEQDVDYDETIKAALDLLIAICGRLDPPRLDESQSQDPAQQEKAINANRAFEDATARASATNVDMFLGLPNALALLLQVLEKGDFYVKFGTIELLTAMAANSRKTLQMAILEAAQGVTRICDLLDDSHRHIRSNAVLLLSTLCAESPEICKIIAFGGVLEKLFGLIDTVVADSGDGTNNSQDSIDDEDSLEAAVVIQDVLLVVRNLITGARTTKTVFRDTGCLQRLVAVIGKAAKDTGIAHTDNRPELRKAVGMAKTVQRQAEKNLKISMKCLTDLVLEGDEESQLMKNDLCNTKLLNTLANIAFFREPDDSESAKASENVLSMRVSAFRAMSCLIRGHEKFRQAFADEQCRDGPGSEKTSIQIATLNAMLRDPSAAIRAAAYASLRDSFVVDSGLDMPSSALLSALADSEGTESFAVAHTRKGSHSSLPVSPETRISSDPTKFIATTLKEVVVGFPSTADAAGVFYAASLVSWVLGSLQGAKQQLLNTQVRGNALLPQIMRVLGKVERERGAAEVRISLFTLVCELLNGSSTAVSAFLSSAMHLPMLVDILRSSGSRGDIAEVHTRGMSAVILGICLCAADGVEDGAVDGSVLSGTSGPSSVIPKGAVAEVIRNRIGVTVFTSCLDDLRATKAFSDTNVLKLPWKSAEELVLLESRNGFLCLNGSLGHEYWYSKNTIDVVNDVYKSVAENVLELVTDSKRGAAPSVSDGANTLSMNGHANGSGSQNADKATLADSARDEVINSYKEFIRTQDENLNAAKSQIEELTAALRQAQLELDKTSSSPEFSKSSESSMNEREQLLAEKLALEGLLEEKTADFEALSKAFTDLEADHNASEGVSIERSEEMAADIQRLRLQNESLKNSLDSEIHKNEDISRRASRLEESVKLKDVELSALASERDSMKTNAHPEVVEALQWRTRAEVAESKIRSRQELIDSYQNSNAALQDQLRDIERTRDEALASVTSLTKRFTSTKSELESLRATRRLELQVSRETSAGSDASAMDEIASLKEQLAEARQNLQKEVAAEAHGPSTAEAGRFEQMQSEYQAVVNAYEKMKTELLDSKQAVVQWQKRAATSETARQREGTNSKRVADHARGLEGQLKELNDALLAHKQTSEASTTRVSELEEQCKEIDEIRKHTEEELITLKEQLASRTEQSIRLSGQLYELEESKDKLEQEIGALRAAFSSQPATRGEVGEPHPRGSTDAKGTHPSAEELQAILAELQEELGVTRDALADSKDRESLSHAQARDRDAMVAKLGSLEHELSTTRASKRKMEEDISNMKERLLSLDEAEESKRKLTMQVVSLQESLAAVEKQGISSTQHRSPDQVEEMKKLEGEIEQLRNRYDEKETRLQGLESSLTLAVDRTKTAEREKNDMEKQVSETEAMFSVLRSERDSLTKEKEELQQKVDELSPLVEDDVSRLEELQWKLTDAETLRDAVSQELSSLVAAVKVSERESRQLKDDSVSLNESLTNAKDELSVMQDECRRMSASRDVDHVVSDMVVDVSLTTQGFEARQAIDTLRAERDDAIAALETSRTDTRKVIETLRLERDEAVAALETLRTADRNATETLRVERDEAVAALESLRTKERKLTENLRVERDEAVASLGSLRTEEEKAVETLRVERDEAVAALETSRTEAHQAIETLRVERDEATTALETAQTEDRKVTETLRVERDEAVTALETSRTEDRKATETLRIERDETVSALETSRAEARQAIEALRVERDEAVTALETSRTEDRKATETIRIERDEAVAALETSRKEARQAIEVLRVERDEATAALETSRTEDRKATEALRIGRDEAVDALKTSRKELESALLEMAKLPFLVKERDEATARNEKLEGSVANLSKELKGLQIVANERDMLASSLEAAKASIDELAEQKAAAFSALEEANVRLKGVKESSQESFSGDKETTEDVAIQRRAQELEEALRDAARTVAATNSELIAAQSLLVDLSADKTSMRTELSSAQEQIDDLVKQVANLSRSAQAVPALSEVSEQEHGVGEDTSVPSASVIEEETTELILQSVQAEASNLRTALQRSMNEADSAVDLVINIEARITEVESRLKESRVMAVSSQESEDALNAELQRLQEWHQSEKNSLQKDAEGYKSRIRDLESEVEQTKEIWKETLSMSEESWSAERGKLENILTDLRNKLNKSTEERSNLQKKVEETVGELEGAKETLEELELSKQSMSSSLKTLEEERSHLKELLEKSTLNEESLKDSLQHMKEDLETANQFFAKDRKRLEGQHQIEVKDLEDELDRASSALESAERAFRDTELSLKEQVMKERASLRDMEQQKKLADESLRAARVDIQRVSSQKDELEANLTDTIRRKDLETSALKTEKNALHNSLTLSREDCVNLRKTLRDSEATLKKTKRDLEEEIEQKALLESENQDFLSTIESLEGSSKRIRSELTQKTNDLNQAEESIRDLQSNLKENTAGLKDLERVIADKSSEIQLLAESNSKLENLKDELNDNLKNTEESRDSLAQDNKDLLAWVSDLEKRATELQSAASDFQEVEQNLRDALESQRFAGEQNSKLVEELRKEKSCSSSALAKVQQVEREKEAAYAERDSSKRRAQELEARIREIRGTNLVKYSQSEDAIRIKAKQCAELETGLAASQRKVAELESVSDDLFGATTSLKQLNEEMSALRERALAAEETAETLRKDLQAAQTEVSDVREQSSGNALRSLEAEHNELLVYLADLELEVTNLREELGRE